MKIAWIKIAEHLFMSMFCIVWQKEEVTRGGQ